MKPDRSEEIGCTFCDWTFDQTPWISGRRLNWPAPIAHLIFLWHRRNNHAEEYKAWYRKYYSGGEL